MEIFGHVYTGGSNIKQTVNFKAQVTSSMIKLDHTIVKVLGNKNWQHDRDQGNLGLQDLKKKRIHYTLLAL